jgi:hypothetical protein
MRQKLFAIIYILSFALFPWLVLSPLVNLPTGLVLRAVIFGLLSLFGAFIFHQAWQRQGWAPAFLITILGYGAAYQFALFAPDISSYPFSLGWSEASRYYYASLWLSKKIYGTFAPPSVLHPSRYLLQALPLLIPNVSLWLNRFWQVLLWVVTSSLTSWLLVRRLQLRAHKSALFVSLGMLFWGILFIFQGPIYYHLLVMVILVLWLARSTHFWRTLVIVAIASLWAGISRVNWLPVPGLLAAALYLMEVEVKGKPVWKYLASPAIWVVIGTGTGYLSQQAYQMWSGNPLAWFNSSFTSDLLWYRLFPNVTYPLGVLPSALLVSLPIIGSIFLLLYPHWREFHVIRLLGLAAILGVLFAGGILVSVKIGGGSNLHNLDAYLTLLMVIGGYIFFDRMQPDEPGLVDKAAKEPSILGSHPLFQLSRNVLLAGALVIPLYFTLSNGGPIPSRDFSSAQAALQTINSASQQTVSQGGEVLFISQRHLLTFNLVNNVPLVPEDELVFLMEMAMSNNSAYMDAFHADISRQRFAMIVSEPLVIQYQGRNHGFGEENDAWVSGVSEPVLCYYEPSITLDSVGVILYTPRANPCK